MKKLTALFLTFVCIFILTGCQLNEPAFKDFTEYNQAFIVVRDFVSAYYLTQNNARLIIDLNNAILSITENKEEGEAELQKAVNKLKEKRL